MNYLILGGGICGLSAAWYLKKKNPDAQITLLEKESRLGGWIQTTRENGYLFEKGPRTFQIGRSPHLLALIQELGLEIIRSEPSASQRYLWLKGKLRSTGSFLPHLIPYLIRECFIPSSSSPDETIYEFASRRFSPHIAETVFDPLTLGIYAGDIRKLSMRACFPKLVEWEQTKGSLVRAFFSSPKTEKGLFTLSGGMASLINVLKERLEIEIVLNCEVEEIRGREVKAGGKIWGADEVISALPPKLPSKSLWVVNIAFDRPVLPKNGFGYLVPSIENESLLGMIWDSSIFPKQNRGNETRLTAMVRAEEKDPLQTALSSLKRHLTIDDEPNYISCFLAKNAIPQFEVGGFDLSSQSRGVSVEDAIRHAIQIISAN